MRRRMRNSASLLDRAKDNIAALEHAHAYQTVLREVDFTHKDLYEAAFPEDIREKLTAAEPFSQRVYHSRAYDTDATVGPYDVHIWLRNIEGMLTPGDHVPLSWDTPLMRRLSDMILRLGKVHDEFNVVREVVQAMDLRSFTAGAMRYYFPGIVALLPEGHAVHACDGTRYTEPARGVGDILAHLHAARNTVAIATFAPNDPRSGLGDLTVTFEQRTKPFAFVVL